MLMEINYTVKNNQLTKLDKPSVDSIEIESEDGVVQSQIKNVYLRSDKSLILNCNVDSNPEAFCLWEIDNEILESSCHTLLEISKSSLVMCKAKNVKYENTFDEKSLNVTLIDADSKFV